MRLELDLYLQLRDLFGLQVELVFPDLTGTYFEGRQKRLAWPPRGIGRCWWAVPT